MKITTLRRNSRRMHFFSQWFGAAVMTVLWLAAANLFAAPAVNWISGGPNYGYPSGAGYVDGDITLYAEYHTPCGIAVDLTGNYLLVADRDNNAVRLLEFDINYAGTLLTMTNYVPTTNLFSKPVGVALDSSYNTFVLNSAKGTNGYVLEFDITGELIATNISHLTNAAGIALDVSDNIYVTASNTVFKITPAGVSNVVATITAPGASLQGIVVKRSGPTAGLLAVCDSGRNGILLINPNTGIVTTNAGFHGAGDFITANNSSPSNIAKFFQPSGIAEAGDGTLIVSDYGNHRVKVVLASGAVTNLYGVTSNDWVYFNTPPWQYPGSVDGTVALPDDLGGVAARQPFGVAFGFGPDGTTPTIYVTEDYYHIIRQVTGTGLQPPPPPPPAAPTGPTATAGYGQVLLTWAGSAGATNYNIKRSTSSGGETTIGSTGSASTSYNDTNVLDGTTYYYVISALNTGGESLNSIEVSAMPLFSPAPTNLIVVTTNFGLVSLAWAPSAGATSYNIKRSTSTNTETTLASTASTSYSDKSVVNGGTYYYVVSAVNPGGENPTNSTEVRVTVPIPPPPSPIIGWFDYEGTAPPVTVFHPVSGTAYITHNDLFLAIEPAADGVGTYYTDDGSDPSANNGGTPPPYKDGLTFAQPLPVTIVPDLTIKAVNVNSGGSSAIVTAEFIFQVGNPSVIGDNAAQFGVSNVTIGAQMYYTTDGSPPDPTNASAIGPISSGQTLSLNFGSSTNLLFKVRGFKANYQPSSIVTNVFSITNFVANTISFGFASGEASSDFVASPGQIFVAPVTLTILPNTLMYSLQFNLTVTNAGPNPGPAIAPDAFIFNPFLMKPAPDLGPNLYTSIPPYMFINNAVGGVPPGQIIPYEGTNFVNLVTYNTALNLMGVGWLERAGQTNLYNTVSQDLIQYSLAHDTLFLQNGGQVVVGAYKFAVPLNAAPGQTYQIQIGRPSATSDGIGRPGFSVYIATPTNGSLAGGAINSIKNVVVGQRKYIAGDAAPFRWFNAGDFGNTNLDNSDVEQVFQSAIYSLNSPPAGSDFFDSMDSCGDIYIDNGYGYLEDSGVPANTALLFDGNDTTINQIAFGNGVLDACDVYVTYRRSLDPSLIWFRRFWTNDVAHGYSGIAAETTSNVFNASAVKQPLGGKVLPAVNSNNGPFSITNTPSANFTAGDFQATAGQTIQIPITASVFGQYPLRVAMLNISVVPLDGSPALTTPISFSPGTALGAPTPGFTVSQGPGNYAAAWLDSTIGGISNSATIGMLNVTIPANATSSSAYAIHFDHASGSPNGLASFTKHALTGLITLSGRTNSYYHDGIPDSWRLRYFGTIYNYLSVSNACPSGDGVNNWGKYVAGVDPNTPNDFPSLNPNTPPPSGAAMSIYWPTVSGKQYAILSSASLFPGNWITNTTVTGNGANMEFDDHSTGTGKFYRVLILP